MPVQVNKDKFVRFIYNPDYLKDDAGFFFFRTNNTNKPSAILLCGDLAVWLGVEPDESIDFFGLQNDFNDAPKNNGWILRCVRWFQRNGLYKQRIV